VSLVLLHSSGATAAIWDRVREHCYGIPVITPELPGRYGSVVPERVDGVPAYGEAVLRALDSAGVDRATIGGASLGGAIALWLALEHRDRVAGIGLIATGARLRVVPAVLDGLVDGLRGVMDRLIDSSFGEEIRDRDRIARRRMYESVGAETTLADLSACDRFDVLDRLWEIEAPAVIVAGTADRLTPPKYAVTMHERIKGSRLVQLPRAGHMLMWERAEEVAAELVVLWAATAPTGARAGSRTPSKGPGSPGSRSAAY
jgi:pimeloyl-ACP methyl ester carboxylesterase